jgi:transposase
MPPAKVLLADRGYDADWLRDALAERGTEACIPSKSNRKIQIPHDRHLYRKRHRIENMFVNSSTGGASTPATTAARTPSCPQSQSQSQPSSSSGYDQ